MGIALHIAGDLITSFGTMILWPVSDMRPGLGSTFIIDPWFSGIIVAGLVVSILFRQSSIPSAAAAIVLAGYVSFQTMEKQKALEFARGYARSRYGDDPAGKEAWDSPALGFMRWFADQPALDATTANPECYWFLDLRFANPGRDWIPFQFGACRDSPGAPWRAVEKH